MVIYKFTRRGYKLLFRDHSYDNPLTVQAKFELEFPPSANGKSETDDEDDTNAVVAPPACEGGEITEGQHNRTKKKQKRSTPPYVAHPIVQSRLLELLLQFSETQGGVILSNAFESKDKITLKDLQIHIHEHITIKGEGALFGYSDFRVYATNKFGNSAKPRYDIVEITIPSSSGGQIAGAADLIRVTEDTALAKVLAIVTLRYYEREMCLLFVNFMKKVLPSEGAAWKRHLRKYTNGVDNNTFYGKAHPYWIALYPILTLKGPALEVPDAYHNGFGHVFPTKFFCRGGWWPESNSAVAAIEPAYVEVNEEISDRVFQIGRENVPEGEDSTLSDSSFASYDSDVY